MVPMHFRMDLSAIMAFLNSQHNICMIQPPKKTSRFPPCHFSPFPAFCWVRRSFVSRPPKLPNVLTMEGLPMTRGPSLAGSALRPAGPAGPAPSLAPCTAMAGPAPPRAVTMAAGAFAVAVAGKAVGTGRPAKWEVGITIWNNYIGLIVIFPLMG